jgi:hypothetical protein
MRGGYIICKSIVFKRTWKEEKKDTHTHTHNHPSKIELDEKAEQALDCFWFGEVNEISGFG